MEGGGTLQDSVISYQLMHMYTALQCRHSDGFTLHITFRTELFERGLYHNGIQGLFLQSKQCSVNPPGWHRVAVVPRKVIVGE